LSQPGDVDINQCMITSPRGSLNLNHMFMSSRVYESTLCENNILELDLFDTDDSLGNLTVQGDETITYSFNAPGTPVVTYVFALDKVELVDVTGSQKGKQYIIHGVGKETMFSKANFIQKAYNTDIASIVEDIHKTFLKSKNKIKTEKTDGIQKIIIPNMKPFQAIDMVRRRATSLTNLSSTFVYFENAEGHNFKTIEGMMKDDVVKTFVHGDALGNSIFNNVWNNIINYEVPKIISSTERIAMGGLTQRVGTFDVRSRSYKFKDQKMDVGNFNSSFFRNLYGITYGLFHLMPQNSFVNKTFIERSTPQQMAFLANISQCLLTLYVYGDTTVKAGDTIQVNIPQAISLTSSPVTDPLISNKYMVSRLCRSIGKIEETPRYTETLECITATQGQGPST
jgi:hypothetical protein